MLCMDCCNKKCISLVTLVISIVLLIQTNVLTILIFNLKGEITRNSVEKVQEVQEKNVDYKNETQEEWKLIIPKINIETSIKEGTDEEVINNNIGHFQETPYICGNIGLVGASCGYEKNYFSNLDELSNGDVVIYIKGNDRKEYKVIENTIINETDWSYLHSTSDNRITLITGILEQPQKRRCVQAVEI